uniref:Uncharacterized protein n=1 Tax=Caenorhabditis japonica TaxID=281687 RepID=A0A8R1EII7_CAEJA
MIKYDKLPVDANVFLICFLSQRLTYVFFKLYAFFLLTQNTTASKKWRETVMKKLFEHRKTRTLMIFVICNCVNHSAIKGNLRLVA